MLQTIRDKTSGIVATLFLGAVALVFIFWGAHGLVDFNMGPKTYAAKVDGERIPTETVRRAWQQRQSQLQQMLRNELPPDLVKSQQSALLDQFVQESLLKQRASRYGYHVSDQDLAARVMEYPQFQIDGKFSKDRYNAVVRASGLTESQFEAELQSGLLIDQLRNAVVESAFVAPYELDRRYAMEKQEREIDYALIAASSFEATTTITDEQVKKWYDQNQDKYLLPETVNLQYIELTREHAESGIQVTEPALKEYFEQVKDRFTTQERRHGRHILITVGEGVDDAAAKQKAEELTAKAKAGADFAQLAKDNSKDPGSAQQGGDLGSFGRGSMVKPFEDAVFAAKQGELLAPVLSDFGWHVIKVTGVRPARTQPFEEVRAQIEGEIKKQKAAQKFATAADQFQNLVYEQADSLAGTGKALDLKVETTGFVSRAQAQALALGNAKFVEVLFSPESVSGKRNTEAIEVAPNSLIAGRIIEHKPAAARPFAEVKDEIRKQLERKAASELAQKAGEQKLALLQAGKSDKEAGLTFGKPAMVGRGQFQAGLPPEVLNRVFLVSTDKLPAYASGTNERGGYSIVRIGKVVTPEDTDKARVDMAANRLSDQIGRELLNAYVASLKAGSEVKIFQGNLDKK